MDIKDLKQLAGITNSFGVLQQVNIPENLSITSTEKSRLQKKHKIEPGTDDWFRLWFSKPHLTGEKPIK